MRKIAGLFEAVARGLGDDGMVVPEIDSSFIVDLRIRPGIACKFQAGIRLVEITGDCCRFLKGSLAA